nr:PREDICTED: uncharacterized protein LOC109039248 [Bemisia tabaci]
MLRMHLNMGAAGFAVNFRNIIVREWMVLLVFACFRELSGGLAMPDDLPKLLGSAGHPTAELPPLNFPEPSDEGFRAAGNGLESPHKALRAPVLSPLTEILRARGSEARLNDTLARFPMQDILFRLNNLTGTPESRHQDYAIQSSSRLVSSLSRTDSMRPRAGAVIEEKDEGMETAELSAKIQATLAKEEDQLIVEPTKSAAGFVLVVVVVSVASYVALFVWRKILEQRYGNREMLIDDDQFCHASNLYDFQLGSENEMS